jgi:hypothetical protein
MSPGSVGPLPERTKPTTLVAMTASIDSFEEAAKLDTTVLRGLLDSARPEQRVWALWALALRVPEQVHGLAQRTATEPSPGVRRTLAVILASHGETDLLVALSRHDPVAAVRESAMQLVTRLAAGGTIDRSVVLEAAHREPALQGAILAGIDAGAPEFLVDLACALLAAGAPAIQLEAVEALVRVDSPTARARLIAWLRDATESQVIAACRRWQCIASPEAIARELAAVPRLRGLGLEALCAPAWHVVELLAHGDEDLIRTAALRADIDPPAHVLARLVLAGQPSMATRRLRAALASLSVAPAELAPLIPELRRHCRSCIDQLRAQMAALERDAHQRLLMSGLRISDDHDDDYDDDESDELSSSNDGLVPFLRHGPLDMLVQLLAELDRVDADRAS